MFPEEVISPEEAFKLLSSERINWTKKAIAKVEIFLRAHRRSAKLRGFRFIYERSDLQWAYYQLEADYGEAKRLALTRFQLPRAH